MPELNRNPAAVLCPEPEANGRTPEPNRVGGGFTLTAHGPSTVIGADELRSSDPNELIDHALARWAELGPPAWCSVSDHRGALRVVIRPWVTEEGLMVVQVHDFGDIDHPDRGLFVVRDGKGGEPEVKPLHQPRRYVND